MYKSQDCPKIHGDEVQRILLADLRCLLHPHLDEEPDHSLPPGQGKAWDGRGSALQGAPKRPTLLQRLAREEDEEEEGEAGHLAALHLKLVMVIASILNCLKLFLSCG